MDAALDGLIALGVELGLIHARPVEAVGGPEPLLRLLPRKRRGVDRQIAALAVAGQLQRPLRPGGNIRHISGGFLLRGHHHEGHVHILHPACDIQVGAPEADADRAVVQIVAGGAELDILFAVDVVHIVVHLPVLIAGQTGADLRQSVALLLKAVQLFRLHIVPQKGPAFPDGMAFPAIQKALEGHVDQLGQDQTVQRVEGPLRQPLPADLKRVVLNVRHTVPPVRAAGQRGGASAF